MDWDRQIVCTITWKPPIHLFILQNDDAYYIQTRVKNQYKSSDMWIIFGWVTKERTPSMHHLVILLWNLNIAFHEHPFIYPPHSVLVPVNLLARIHSATLLWPDISWSSFGFSTSKGTPLPWGSGSQKGCI